MDRSAFNCFWNSCGLYTIATTTSLITLQRIIQMVVVKQKQTKEAFYDDKKNYNYI
jgi:hypothetical protein